MMATTHRLGGLAAGMAMSMVLTDKPKEMILITGLSILGSLLPDIDNGNSTISWKFPLTRIIVAIVQSAVRLICLFLPKKLSSHILCGIGHRGLSHSLAGVGLFFALSCAIAQAAGGEYILVASAVCAGVLSHLFLDMLAGGVPLFYPISTKRITLAHIKTGGFAEWCFRIVFLAAMSYWIYIAEIPVINDIAGLISPYTSELTGFLKNLTL